jgi:HD-GYP domain-containing protein (c-di-GMP phosphodiesterase class II)
MMKLRKLNELNEGDVLGRAVISSDYQILLSERTVLTADYIEKLGILGIADVYIRDNEYYSAEEVAVMRNDIKEVFRRSVKNIMEKHIYANNKELQKLDQTANEIISNILEENDVIDRIFDIKERSSDIYEHSISTCTLATLVSLKLRLDKKTVHDISVACLLHDIGLRYLSFDFENHDQEELNPVEATEYNKHPIYGYTSLKDETWISETSKLIILYHHECIDGSGYPMKMKDSPFEAQIVAVCEVFDEMICGICWKRRKVHEAIEHLRNYRGRKYNETIVNILLEYLAVYPVGTYVVTNLSQVGVVVRQNRGFSDRPVIKLIKDEYGDALEEQILVDLKKDFSVSIDKVSEYAL